MRRFLASLLVLVWLCSPALADYTATQGAGTTFWAQTITAKQMPTFGIGDANAASIIYAPGSTTAGQSGFLFLCRTLTSAPTDTTAQSNVPSCTTAGELRVNATQAGTWNVGTVTTVTTLGTVTTITNPVSVNSFTSWAGSTLGAITTYGTSPGAVLVPSVNAFVTNTNANGAATAANSSPVVIAVDQGASTTGNIVASNTTAVVVNAAATTLYSVQLGGIGSAPAYLKLYNATSATCGAGTPVKRLIIPAAATAANGAGSNITFPLGLRFSTGLTYCVTTGIGDADATAPAASTFLVNLDWR